MIQDIAPHKFDNAYRKQRPEAEDFALFIKEGKTLLMKQAEKGNEKTEDSLVIPTVQELSAYFPSAANQALYLFSIDSKAYFLFEDLKGDIPSCMELQGTQYFRMMKPDYQAFAAITATQLSRWRDSRRFCGHCGTATVHSETERAYLCPSCGQIEYPKISPAVIVAITDGDRLLMSRYRDRPYRGYALIAGFVEIGESFEQTVSREVLEEVGLKVKNIRYFKSQPWAFTDTEMIGFFAELDGDDTIVLEEDELSEAAWYHRDEIPDDEVTISVGSEMKMAFKYGRFPL